MTIKGEIMEILFKLGSEVYELGAQRKGNTTPLYEETAQELQDIIKKVQE